MLTALAFTALARAALLTPRAEMYAPANAPNHTMLPAGRPWRAIDRVPAAEMTAARFRTEYFDKKRPVIVVGAHSARALQHWDFDSLVQQCGAMQLDLRNHHVAFIDSLSQTERRVLDAELAVRHNTSLAQLRARREHGMTLSEWAARGHLSAPCDGRDYTSGADYLAQVRLCFLLQLYTA